MIAVDLWAPEDYYRNVKTPIRTQSQGISLVILSSEVYEIAKTGGFRNWHAGS
jgi:hypothetical protein